MVTCMTTVSDPGPQRPRTVRARGFTMIELIVVMAVIGLLLSIAVPRYLDSVERGREKVLVHNLSQMREAIDRFYGDRGAYPDRLEDLVTYRYLRAVPVNPYTEVADWETDPPPTGGKGSVYDVRAPSVSTGGFPRGASASDADASAQGAAPPANADSAP